MSGMPSEKVFDIIVAGGGTAGCVVASRSKQAKPHLSIALIEAGPEASDNALVQDPRIAPALHDTYLQWKYNTPPQRHLGGRTCPNSGGKMLSGCSGVNYTAWTRGHASDFDAWAQKVGDQRWSYESLLPAFKRSEHWHGSQEDAKSQQHGFNGRIRLQSGDFGFPLRDPMRKAFESTGFKFNPDMNSGDPNGIAPLVVNWHDLKRQHASVCYSLEGVTVLTSTLVECIILSKSEGDGTLRATGVKLAGSGQVLHASKEVIVSCGAIRTPQLLLLSGIGPKDELAKHDIHQQHNLQAVGLNLMDHPAVTMFWKLKDPDKGLAFGSPAFNTPEYANSLPMDWFVTGAISGQDRSDYELAPMYLTNGAVPTPWLPMDGTYISCGVLCLSSTSRGSITLKSKDPHGNPIVNPEYVSTGHDRAVIKAGMREAIKAMASPALHDFVGTESPPPGFSPLTLQSSDTELDARIDAMTFPWFHAAGTTAMGEVVDGDCRLKGIDGLRIVDASVIPVTITAHLQAAVYAIAEQAIDMILASI